MAKPGKWTEQQLIEAAKKSHSIREVIISLGLAPAGGNYVQIQHYIEKLKIDTTHFKGKGWRKNRLFSYAPRQELRMLLKNGTTVQSFKLKKRLFKEGFKNALCEKCGWAEQAEDGRIPVELDHINGDRYDNRLENLRILCPNCHSLQPTHRGMNQKRRKT